MARPSKKIATDVDPATLAIPPKRRKRRARNKPAPDPELDDTAQEARFRADARPYPPGILLEDDGEGWRGTSPHSDLDRWTLQLADAFGTRSVAVIELFVRQLRALCGEVWDDITQSWKEDETELNAMVAMVNDVAPENTQEAALAAQMVAVHLLQMRVTKQAFNRGGHVFFKDAIAAGKLAKVYTEQLAALRRERGRDEVKQQHIHVHRHEYTHTEGPENDGRPQGPRATTIEGRASLPCDREGNGKALPSPGNEGQEGMPQARRRGSRRQEG